MNLDPKEFRQYSRQLIVDGFGLPAQQKLKNAKVLIIGAGGLGCPAIAYLACAGVGVLGIVDPDVVELSNIHRQILHSRASIGLPKVDSAAKYVEDHNPQVKVVKYICKFDVHSAVEIATGYDLILDCTDRVTTRYLASDTAVKLGVPLVSAAALRLEGQLTVYNYINGPCYRCLHPIAPPASTVVACSDGGVLGPVVGMLGTAQASEAIRIITSSEKELQPNCMWLFRAFTFPQWKIVRVRGRQKSCAACGEGAKCEFGSVPSTETEPMAKELSADQRLNPDDAYTLMSNKSCAMIDVRPPVQFEIGSIPGAVNIPLADIKRGATLPTNPVFFCLHGVDSAAAVQHVAINSDINAKHIEGGLYAWASQYEFIPLY